MNESKIPETKLREQLEMAAARPQQSSAALAWKIVGGVALGLVAAGLVASLNDIRKYIRMVRM